MTGMNSFLGILSWCEMPCFQRHCGLTITTARKTDTSIRELADANYRLWSEKMEIMREKTVFTGGGRHWQKPENIEH